MGSHPAIRAVLPEPRRVLLIGILSDSHNREVGVRRAVALFDSLGVGHIIHCGDIGGMGVFDHLIGRPCTFVWGNTDRLDRGLSEYLRSVGMELPTHIPTRIDLDGKRFAVYHGHEPGFDHALVNLEVDYILHGHSHRARDERIGSRRIINPGALYQARMKTVATLDTADDVLTFHEIADKK